ncbi:MAG: hypothetical protein M0R76_10490 [Proteobacteria bacterium]|jgi:hypothetical protein|nr:hypothetical protein [Pseudomonadota bacterium]NLN63781.1 hypothetical protein [Myxococcales bacterium]
MIKFALIPIVVLAALVPQCTGTTWGHVLLIAISSGILFGTLSLGRHCNRDKTAQPSK